MKLEDVVSKVRASDDGSGLVFLRNGQVDLDYIVQRTVEALGLQIADDGAVLTPMVSTIIGQHEWEPPGGLVRPHKTYRNGRGVRK